MNNVLHTQNCIIQPVNDPEALSRDISWDVLRIDRIHPVVSGNKWFKLAPYLAKARQAGYRGLASFGGAWSNHLHALAFAAREAGRSSLGLVRGEEPPTLSQTLADARDMGMELIFLPRKTYGALSKGIDEGSMGNLLQEILAAAPQSSIHKKITWSDYLLIPEGGYGKPGMEGAAGIWSLIPQGVYTHLLCAVGTGTMMAGLITGARQGLAGPFRDTLPEEPQGETQDLKPHPDSPAIQVIGIPVLRNESSLEAEIRALLPTALKDAPIHLDHRFHGGGYAKTSSEQLAFMSSFYALTGIPTDIIYTSKLMHAAWSMVREGYFPPKSRILVIHSGGLQGNRSLKKGILPF
jgi:1-aminocyclopropane-1-carboxylate deaminase